MGVRDPLAGDREPCTCEHGWKQVTAEYALHLYPDLTMAAMAALPPDAQVHAAAQLTERRHAAANSVYPCRHCRPDTFFRWAGKHYEADHYAGECEECIDLLGGKRAARRVAAHQGVSPPARADVDF